MMNALVFVLLAACAFEFPALTVAADKSYELAKITVISPLQVQVPVPITGTPMTTVPTTLGYELELLQGDLVYRGFCQHECRPEWKVGKEVHFRHNSSNIYLQRRNGKELKLNFLLQSRREADGTLNCPAVIWTCIGN